MRSGEGFILVFAINSRSSFQEMQGFVTQIKRVKDTDNVPMVLVGNKCDLESERQVSTAEAKEQAKLIGCEFIESSARNGKNVEDAYFMLVKKIRQAGKESKSKKKKYCVVM